MPYTWVHVIKDGHLAALYQLYSKEWWTKDRTRAQIDKMLKGSDLVFGCCDSDGRLAGFARVLTDYTFKAMIFDVIVSDDFRGRSIGSALITRILQHPDLQPVTSFELYCPDRLVPYYERFGFAAGSAKLLSLKKLPIEDQPDLSRTPEENSAKPARY